MIGGCHANEGVTLCRGSCRHGNTERNKWNGSTAQVKRKWQDCGKIWRRPGRKRESWREKGCDYNIWSVLITLFLNQYSSLSCSTLFYSILSTNILLSWFWLFTYNVTRGEVDGRPWNLYYRKCSWLWCTGPYQSQSVSCLKDIVRYWIVAFIWQFLTN